MKPGKSQRKRPREGKGEEGGGLTGHRVGRRRREEKEEGEDPPG